MNYRSEIFALIAYFIFVFRSVDQEVIWPGCSLTSTDNWVYLKNTHSLAAAFPGNLNFRKFFSSTHAWPAFLCLDCAPFEGQSGQSWPPQDCHFPNHYSDSQTISSVMTGSSEKKAVNFQNGVDIRWLRAFLRNCKQTTSRCYTVSTYGHSEDES